MELSISYMTVEEYTLSRSWPSSPPPRWAPIRETIKSDMSVLSAKIVMG